MATPLESHGTAAPAACPAHHGFTPFDQTDPFPSYAALRREEPVMYDERIDYWVVTRYDDIKAVFGDWETFSSENAQAPVRERGPEATRIMNEGGFTAYSGLSARVPPEHERIRKVAAKAFTPRRFKALEPTIRANVDSELQRLLAHEDKRGDLVRDLAYDIPTVTILTLIGADTGDVPKYKRWSDSRSAMTWGGPLRRGADPARAQPRRILAGMPPARRRRPRERPRQPRRGPGARAGRRLSDQRPRDRLGVLQPPVRGP